MCGISGLGLRRLEHEGKPRSLEASLVDVTGINDNWSKKYLVEKLVNVKHGFAHDSWCKN